MADFQLVDPQGWEWDLQSIYSAYMNHFQLHNVPWYDRTWGHLFANFETFLAFSWPVIVVTDVTTGRAHIVARTTSIGAFLKMIKTRFGENLPMVDNMLRVSPFETHSRHLRTVSDASSYKKLHGTLPAARLAAQKIRVRQGEPRWVQELWDLKDRIFMAVGFEWSERNKSSCLEWGYAALRCGHLDARGIWPPLPDKNYRKGHFIVAEYLDKVHNKYRPNFPREARRTFLDSYAFGDSQVVSKAKLPEIIQATISSFASPDSETVPNQLVIVTHGVGSDLDRLSDLKVKLPTNVLTIDTATFERQLFSKGLRKPMIDTHTTKARQPGTVLSLSNTLRSLNLDLGCIWHCSGNDAFGVLLALQMLLQPDTKIPPPKMLKSARSHSSSPIGTPLLYSSVRPGGAYLTPSSLTGLHPHSSSSPTPASPRSIRDYFDTPEIQVQQRRTPGRNVHSQASHQRSSFVSLNADSEVGAGLGISLNQFGEVDDGGIRKQVDRR